MKKTNQRQILFPILISRLLFLTSILSCQQDPQYSCRGIEKFDRAKWAEFADLMTFPNRNCMVDDLVRNYNLKGKELNTIIDLLGQPQYALDSTMEIGYKIEEDFGSDIDPIYTKTLLIRFNNNALVETVEIKEWRK